MLIGLTLVSSGQPVGKIATACVNTEQHLASSAVVNLTHLTAQAAVSSASVMGIACKLAGEISSPRHLWNALEMGNSYVTHSPPKRWHDACKKAGAADEILVGAFVDLQDLSSRVTGLPSKGQVEQWDLHIQLMLVAVLEALQDADWGMDTLRGEQVAVSTAVAAADLVAPMYSWMISRVLAGYLQTDGPNRNIEAACASGYLGICDGFEMLCNGTADRAVIGGSSLMLEPSASVSLWQLGALSKSGRCAGMKNQMLAFVLTSVLLQDGAPRFKC